ncbi:hypothetical protein NXZ77_23020 [Lysinibacillus boronitolerans]|nr:hypothetical protein [Lysinibacillus boronitolerans]MCS1394428.1 hypothetical protein [Lysinibacillus boronitolerans]
MNKRQGRVAIFLFDDVEVIEGLIEIEKENFKKFFIRILNI